MVEGESTPSVAVSEGLAAGAGALAAIERLARQLEAGAAGAGVDTEISAARYALARLLREETDPVALAEGIAAAAGVVFKARQIQRLESGASVESLADAATRILEELGYGDR